MTELTYFIITILILSYCLAFVGTMMFFCWLYVLQVWDKIRIFK